MRLALVLWAVAGLLFVLMAIPAVRDVIDRFDSWFHELTFPIKWGPVTVLAHTLDFLGSGFFLWPLRIVVAGVLAYLRRWEAFAVWVIVVVVSEPAIGLLKWAYGRPRPPEPLVEAMNASFPSGHAIAGAVVAITLVVVWVPAGP